MVPTEPEPSTRRPTLIEAGEAYREARRLHAETFLRHKVADPRRTDGVARAMADVEVDLAGAEVDWEIAKGLFVDYGIMDGSLPEGFDADSA